ncbi:MAG: hypothetical protein NTZ39_06065 [Methanoregula sp.]|nr:hypothetical protein [Methanoregula sp.]
MKVKSLETYRTDDLKKENLGWPPKTFESLIYTSETSIPIFLSQLEDTPLLNGISLNIFLHTYDVNDPIQVKAGNASKNALKDLTIKIKYTSIYDEEQPERIVPLYHFNDNVTNF